MSRLQNVTVESARVIFKNFSGKATKYNAEGNRNFCVLLDKEDAEDLQSQGWNIRWLQAREEGDEDQAYVQVAVKYGFKPPKVILISGDNKTPIGEDLIDMLDWAEIENIDLIINPSSWEVNGKTGIKAYLKTMYVTLVVDELEAKYSDVPMGAKQVIMQEENV